MHNPQPTNKGLLEFYVTPEHTCPYLEEQQSKTLFMSREIEPNDRLYDSLINNGFRRSGDHIYRPHCADCKACISIRIACEDFSPSKQQKRCAKKGTRFSQSIQPACFDQLHYGLFERYINSRHTDGDMYPTSEKQYKDFILCDWLNTQFLDLLEPTTGDLIGCLVFDELKSGTSAIYSFFDPDYSKFSPGRLLVLNLISLTKQKQLEYVYLGYWIKNCRKMSYKGEYRPIECFTNDHWVRLS
jgi:arginine-tRNA-protein transferase